jgi:type IV pilus assembly protein PilO
MANPALEDFARRPTSYKAAVFGGVFLLFAGAYWQFGYKPLSEELETQTGNSEQMASQKVQLGKDEEAFRELQTRMVSLKKMIDENQKALPTGAELPAFFDTLNRKVSEAGVEIRKWEYKSDIPVAAFVKVPVDLEVTGTFFQLKRFFASLVQRGIGRPGDSVEQERIVTIENLQLTAPTVRNREIVLTARFTASTFRQEETDPVVIPLPGGAPAMSPPVPSPGGASTPSGARGQVESSTQLHDDKVRKGSDMEPSPIPQGAAPTSGNAQAGVDRLKGGI